MRTDSPGAPQQLSLRGGLTTQKLFARVMRSDAVLGPFHIAPHLIQAVGHPTSHFLPSPSIPFVPRLPEAPCCSGPAKAFAKPVQAEEAGTERGTPPRRTCRGKEEPEEDMLKPMAGNSNGGTSGLLTSAGGILGTEGPFWNSPKYPSYVTTYSANSA